MLSHIYYMPRQSELRDIITSVILHEAYRL